MKPIRWHRFSSDHGLPVAVGLDEAQRLQDIICKRSYAEKGKDPDPEEIIAPARPQAVPVVDQIRPEFIESWPLFG